MKAPFLIPGPHSQEGNCVEEELRATLKECQEFRKVFDEHAVVALCDSLGKITYVNDRYCTISQYSRTELLGQDHWVINSGDHPKPFMRDLWQTISGGRVWHGDIRNRAKDGSLYWMSGTIVPSLGEDGKPYQYISIQTDISKQRRTEEALVASELRYRRLFESAKDGILILNADTGKVVEVNPFLITLLGFSREQFLGKTLWELGFFKDVVANEEKFSEMQKKEYLRYENLPLKTVEGRPIEVEFISNVYSRRPRWRRGPGFYFLRRRTCSTQN